MKKMGLRRLNREHSTPVSPDGTNDPPRKGFRRRLRVFTTPRSNSEGKLLFRSKSSTSSSRDDWTLETLDDENLRPEELALITPTSSDLVHPHSLPDSLDIWMHSLHALLQSPELHQCLDASAKVLWSAADLAWKTALLPITLPVHVVGTGTDLVLHTSGAILHNSIQLLFNVPGTIFGMVGHVKDGVGGVLLSLVGGQKQIEDESYLDRLRLDFEDTSSNEQRLFSPDYSKYLLRTDDLGIMTRDDKPILYVDLEGSKQLLEETLPRLMQTGLALLSNHPTVRLSAKFETNPECEVCWNPEGATNKHMRKMVNMSSMERLSYLEKEILVWSGKYLLKGPKPTQEPLPFFLARGIIRKSPRDFLNLLWDNERTSEYNNFCLGRTTLLALDDKILDGASEGTKAVCSETRIPFTSLSIMVTCMMHVRALPAPDEGFVILTRSLDSGVAGTHIETDQNIEKGKQKSEIMWGINILRKVPNHPHLTDLTSLSQVNSPMVPKFLAGKIATMGVQEFFENIRKHRS